MEEVDMDDFGDIYADVEGYVNAGVSMIPSIRQLYLEDRAQAKLSPAGDHGDSEDKERMLYGRIGRNGRPDGSPAPVAAAAAPAATPQASEGKQLPEGSGGGGDDEVTEESNDSDSDDDLRIVLNEEDCKRFGALQRVGLGNGGLLSGACANEDEDDESMMGTCVENSLSKDQKWADLAQSPADGVELSGLERFGSLKGGFPMPYSQFKYVRSQLAGCPSNAKSAGQGYVVPFSSPMASRGDRDMGVLLAATSCHMFPVPRNRTIFDISIESFDRKPWRNEGVDITDFFNFGLNEESWKQYCDNMVLFRKQATWITRNTICGSIRPNQVSDSGFLHGPTSAEASLSEVTHLELGGTAASAVAKPKGKAIQVDGGSGERVPSVDVRRPRYQDSDVVIQIPVEGSDQGATMLSKDKPEHFDACLPHSDSGGYGGSSKADLVHSLPTLCCDGHKNEEAVDDDKKEHTESRGAILRRPKEELRSPPDAKGIVCEKPKDMDIQILGTTPASADEVLHSTCQSSPVSISESSKDDLSADKLQSPDKRSSFGSVTGSDISVGSSSDTSHAERVNDRANTHDASLYLQDQRCQSGTEHCGVVVEDGNDSTGLDRIVQINSDSLRTFHAKLGKRPSCNRRGGEHTSSLEQSKISKSRESWRHAGKWLCMSSHAEHSRRSELDHYSRGNCHRKRNRHERRDCRHNDVKKIEFKIPNEDENGWEMEFVVHKDRCTHSIPDHMPFCTEQDWDASHRSKAAHDYRQCVKPDVIFEDRYMKEGIEVNNSKHFPYFGRNQATQDGFDRNTPYRAQGKRSSQRRDGYDRNLCIDMDDSEGYVEDAGEHWRYSDHRVLDVQTFRGSPPINGRAWHALSLPRIYKHNSRRSSEIYGGRCRILRARDARFNEQKEWDLLYPCMTNSYFSSCRDHCETGSGHYSIEGRGSHAPNTLSNEGRKSSHVSQPRHMTKDQVCLRQQVLDDSHFPEEYFSHKRIYRDENGYDNHKSLASLKLLHSHSLMNENGTRVLRKTDSRAKEQNCVRHRKAVNGRLNGYEGKLLGKFDEVAYKKKKIRDDKMEGSNDTDEICWRKENAGKGQKMEDNSAHVICSTVENVLQCDSANYGIHFKEEPDEPAVMHDQDVSGLEEGQLVESEDDDDAGTKAEKWDTEETAPISSAEVKHTHDEKKKQVNETNEKKKQVKETSDNKRPIEEYDNSRILETLAKMEKRRERFKEPVAAKKEQGNALNTLSQTMVVGDEIKLERPARKRRWGAVKNPAA